MRYKQYCRRCGHEWLSKSESGPKVCPSQSCGSPNWYKSDEVFQAQRHRFKGDVKSICLECGNEYELTDDHPFYCFCQGCAPNGVGYGIVTHRPETRHGSRHGAAL